jgi:hypothetical protein
LVAAGQWIAAVVKTRPAVKHVRVFMMVDVRVLIEACDYCFLGKAWHLVASEEPLFRSPVGPAYARPWGEGA